MWAESCNAAARSWGRRGPWSSGSGTVAGGLLGSLLAPWLGLVLGALAAMATAWGLRFKPSPDAVAWRQGAAGERRTARLLGPLERHGWAILHDLAVPGSTANLDHLVIGPGGVFVIDSKQCRAGCGSTLLGSYGMAAIPSPRRWERCRGRRTRPLKSCPTRAWPWCLAAPCRRREGCVGSPVTAGSPPGRRAAAGRSQGRSRGYGEPLMPQRAPPGLARDTRQRGRRSWQRPGSRAP